MVCDYEYLTIDEASRKHIQNIYWRENEQAYLDQSSDTHPLISNKWASTKTLRKPRPRPYEAVRKSRSPDTHPPTLHGRTTIPIPPKRLLNIGPSVVHHLCREPPRLSPSGTVRLPRVVLSIHIISPSAALTPQGERGNENQIRQGKIFFSWVGI